MKDLTLHDTYIAMGTEPRILTWLYGVVLILAAAALVKYLFLR